MASQKVISDLYNIVVSLWLHIAFRETPWALKVSPLCKCTCVWVGKCIQRSVLCPPHILLPSARLGLSCSFPVVSQCTWDVPQGYQALRWPSHFQILPVKFLAGWWLCQLRLNLQLTELQLLSIYFMSNMLWILSIQIVCCCFFYHLHLITEMSLWVVLP